MAKITLDAIKSLRMKTGVGIHQVKEALENTNGDEEKAILYLREKGIAKAAKRSDKATNNGFIGHYIHGKGAIAVIVELQSETDFAANSEEFQSLAKEVAMHIAAKSPEYLDIESIPQDVLETEKKVFAKDLKGKPENIQEKILEGKLKTFYMENVLLKQTYVRDEEKTIEDLLNDTVAVLGESIKIRRFVRMTLGGDIIMAETTE
jgi:elongation factor Ts